MEIDENNAPKTEHGIESRDLSVQTVPKRFIYEPYILVATPQQLSMLPPRSRDMSLLHIVRISASDPSHSSRPGPAHVINSVYVSTVLSAHQTCS
jgi:hypothetical protein